MSTKSRMPVQQGRKRTQGFRKAKTLLALQEDRRALVTSRNRWRTLAILLWFSALLCGFAVGIWVGEGGLSNV